VPLEVISLQHEYRDTVIAYVLEELEAGHTPSPDVLCNRAIKFGAFVDRIGDRFDMIASGHHARVAVRDGLARLLRGADPKKDQTYFLCQLRQDQLARCLFPIGHLSKAAVRAEARRAGLPNAERPDSQGICFLGKINYNDFIRKYAGENPGEIVELETGKVWGEHKGLWFHTIGQRKGLGLSQGPWFVVKKDLERNILYISNGYDPIAQYTEKIMLADFQFINENHAPDMSQPLNISFKIRHQPEFSKGTLAVKDELLMIEPAEAISGVAPGQFGVIYDEEQNICLGSGVITL
jgi:tRNA-specific 2-thiouridylase